MAPLDEGGLHRRYAVFSNLVDTVQTVTQRAEERAWQRLGRDGQEAATIAEAVGEVCSSPPAQAWGHQRCAGHHHRVFGHVAGRHAANKTMAKPQLGQHRFNYRHPWRGPGREAINDQERMSRQ